jgi:acetyl esterase/lipase
MNTKFYLILSIYLFFVGGNNVNGSSPALQNEIPVVQSAQTYNVLVKENIVYAEGLCHDSLNSENATTIPLKLDVYIPDNDIENRPAFLFIHGGGFSGGSKQQSQIINWANYYTSRGWVFISIDYRLKRDKGTVPKQWVDYTVNVPKGKGTQFLAVYPAIRDAKAALRWLIANADTYNINTNYITVGGSSSGAVTAVTIGISNQEDYRDEIDTNQDLTLSSTNLEQSYQIRTIVDLWGSKTGLDILEKVFNHQRFDSNDPSLFIAHGTKDPTVPFSKAEDLKSIYKANGVPLCYYPLEGFGHGAWNATVNNKRLEELAFEFIVEQQKLIME